MSRSTLLLLTVGVAAGIAGPWDDWQCPGFPCFIVNANDPRNTTASRIETCGPFTVMDQCLSYQKAGHPCDYPILGVCDQSSCVQGTLKKCQAFCSGLLVDGGYRDTCNKACARWCA